MGHYAKVESGIIVHVIVAEQGHIDSLPDKDKWVKTSYNTHRGIHYKPNSRIPSGRPGLRKNYASLGYTYDEGRDAFIPPKPYPSWVFNEDAGDYDPPTPRPPGMTWRWNESTKEWDNR